MEDIIKNYINSVYTDKKEREDIKDYLKSYEGYYEGLNEEETLELTKVLLKEWDEGKKEVVPCEQNLDRELTFLLK